MPTLATSRRTAVQTAAKHTSRKRPKAAEMVAAELRHQIVSGRLKPGDKLHPENVLQTEFAISRPTLREALRLLESESLIHISRGQHGGARVSSIDLRAAARQVGVFLQIVGTTLQDVWLARTIIEPPAVGLLAALRDPAAFAELACQHQRRARGRTARSDPLRRSQRGVLAAHHAALREQDDSSLRRADPRHHPATARACHCADLVESVCGQVA